jgi:hypothetical protein
MVEQGYVQWSGNMIKRYLIIKDAVVDNLVVWDKEAHPDMSFDGEAIEQPVLTTLVPDGSGNDVEVEWLPGIGDKCVIGGEFKKAD